MSKFEVHPVADLFPMLADDELKELAEDIKARGLLQPIVLDVDGRVLDGRNRLAACKLAEVEPTFETYKGDDPNGYALSVNIARRHLRPSQRYILIERARRLAQLPKSVTGVNINRLSEAAIVLDFAPDLADVVLANGMSLDTAADTARRRKREALEIKVKKERLTKAAPDLADQVDDDKLSLDEALGALAVREERARQEVLEAQRAEEARRSAEEREIRQRQKDREDELERERARLRSVISGWPTMRNTILPDPDGPEAKEIIAGLGEFDREAIAQILNEVTG